MKNWASYRPSKVDAWEGPFIAGTLRMRPPASVQADIWEKALYVTTSTEGGCFDAINMYDKCIVSPGLIQVCELAPIFGASALFGGIAERCGEHVLKPIRETCARYGAEFKRAGKKWRFYLGGSPIEKAEQQRTLLLGGSTGRLGEWTAAQRIQAMDMAEAFAAFLRQPNTVDAHIDFVHRRLPTYVTPSASKFWLDVWGRPSEESMGLFGSDWEPAFAAYVSFGVNRPAGAAKYLERWLRAGDVGDRPMFSLLRALTLGPGIAIYPHRYKAIGKAIYQLWGVELPELVYTAVVELSVEEAQKLLLQLGYDLGPEGATGVDGAATHRALRLFQTDRGLPVTEEFDAATLRELQAPLG